MFIQLFIYRNPASKRIFDAIQIVIEFIVVFISILLEFIRSTVEGFLPQKLKDISGEIVLVKLKLYTIRG